jgi:hypothetical protein
MTVKTPSLPLTIGFLGILIAAGVAGYFFHGALLLPFIAIAVWYARRSQTAEPKPSPRVGPLAPRCAETRGCWAPAVRCQPKLKAVGAPGLPATRGH